MPKPYKYQEEDTDRLLSTLLSGQKGVLLASEPGVGKSCSAVCVTNLLCPKSILTIGPANSRINWTREIAMWDVWGREPQILTTKTKALPLDAVINYDILHRMPELSDVGYELVIADESHYIKNPKSKRSKAFKRICDKAKHVILLSGTPLENRPVELFWQMVCMGWLKPGDYGKYVRRHCGFHKKTIYVGGRPRDIIDVSGATRLPELRSFLVDRGMVRRKKSEVLTELPPKTHMVIEIPRKTQWRSSLMSNAISSAPKTSQVKYLKNLKAAALASGAPADKQRLVDSIAEARKLDGIAKLDQVVQFAKDKLEGGVEKLIIFAHHTEVIEGLEAALKEYGAVSYYGKTPKGKRQPAIDRFQEDPKIRVFIGNYRAAGTAITLTAAHHVILAELDWVPGVVSQASDRAHRNGQRSNVTVYYMVFEDSTDALVVRSLIDKQKTLDYLLDGEGDGAGSRAPREEIDPFELFD